MLPLGAILLAVFCAWIMHDRDTAEELGMSESSLGYKSWHWVMRVIAPVLVVIVFLHAVGIDVFTAVGLGNDQ
jgi:NSS family neurotransmitter:Na+ symporter